MTDAVQPRRRAKIHVSLAVLAEIFKLPEEIEVLDVLRESGDFSRGTVTFVLSGAGLPDAAIIPAEAAPGETFVELVPTYEKVWFEQPVFRGFEQLPPPSPELAGIIDAALARARKKKPT